MGFRPCLFCWRLTRCRGGVCRHCQRLAGTKATPWPILASLVLAALPPLVLACLLSWVRTVPNPSPQDQALVAGTLVFGGTFEMLLLLRLAGQRSDRERHLPPLGLRVRTTRGLP